MLRDGRERFSLRTTTIGHTSTIVQSALCFTQILEPYLHRIPILEHSGGGIGESQTPFGYNSLQTAVQSSSPGQRTMALIRLPLHLQNPLNSFLLKQYHPVRLQTGIKAAGSHSPATRHLSSNSSASKAHRSLSALFHPTDSPKFLILSLYSLKVVINHSFSNWALSAPPQHSEF